MFGKNKENEIPRMFLYAVHDEKAETYGPPMAHPSAGVAIRGFTAACQNKQSFLAQFPSDYSLYCIGHYDDRTGKCVAFPEPRFLIRASEIVAALTVKEQLPDATVYQGETA